MEPYVSPELTQRIRVEQRSLRDALSALESSSTDGSEATRSGSRNAMKIFRAYETLVDALLEAVETDNPTPVVDSWSHAFGTGDAPVDSDVPPALHPERK